MSTLFQQHVPLSSFHTVRIKGLKRFQKGFSKVDKFFSTTLKLCFRCGLFYQINLHCNKLGINPYEIQLKPFREHFMKVCLKRFINKIFKETIIKPLINLFLYQCRPCIVRVIVSLFLEYVLENFKKSLPVFQERSLVILWIFMNVILFYLPSL